jgi:hypothetical protein
VNKADSASRASRHNATSPSWHYFLMPLDKYPRRGLFGFEIGDIERTPFLPKGASLSAHGEPNMSFSHPPYGLTEPFQLLIKYYPDVSSREPSLCSGRWGVSGREYICMCCKFPPGNEVKGDCALVMDHSQSEMMSESNGKLKKDCAFSV